MKRLPKYNIPAAEMMKVITAKIIFQSIANIIYHDKISPEVIKAL